MPKDRKDNRAGNNSTGGVTGSSRNELIPTIRKDNQNFVNAKVLFDKLQPNDTNYSRWLTKLISKYGFIKNFDYSIPKQYGIPNYLDATLTLDMAKEVAMVQESDMGRKIRKYFIEMEKAARKYMGTYSFLDEIDYWEEDGIKWYVYATVLGALKYSSGGSAYKRQVQYSKDFRSFGGDTGRIYICISEEFACMLADSKRIANRRKEKKAEQLSLFPNQDKKEGGI